LAPYGMLRQVHSDRPARTGFEKSDNAGSQGIQAEHLHCETSRLLQARDSKSNLQRSEKFRP
jgi:hypothetical protein